MELEVKEVKNLDLPVIQHCLYCHQDFIDLGCGICNDCYWDAFFEIQL